MRYAIISDVHANDEALSCVLADASRQGARQIVCLGDIVGYGPMPSETLAHIRDASAITVAGNHDDAVSGRIDASNFTGLAADAAFRHREILSAEDIAWLKNLPYTAKLEGGAYAAHGDFTDPQKFYYIENEADAAENFKATDAQLLFVGHTHTPALFLTGRSGAVYSVSPQDFTMEDGKRYIVNPGSVGYPRESNGECRSSYVIYDSDERTVTFRYLPFFVESLLQRGKTPRRPSSKRKFAYLLLAAALIAGISLWSLTPRPAASEQETSIGEKTLILPAGSRAVRANLKVENGPVLLRLFFIDAGGNVIETNVRSVKKSAAGRETVPAGAASVRFTLSSTRSGAEPAIRSFAPTAE